MYEELREIYKKIRPEIETRLNEFKKVYEQDDREILFELLFCLLTPQSKARVCWRCIEEIKTQNVLSSPDPQEILEYLTGVRFKYKKSQYIVQAILRFSKNGKICIKEQLEGFKSPYEIRVFLVKTIKGLGMKEASHFLRNIGKGDDIAILDRHILRNLHRFNVIDEIPKTLSKGKYLSIEEKMRKFSRDIQIPMDHLDLLLWYREAGEVFK